MAIVHEIADGWGRNSCGIKHKSRRNNIRTKANEEDSTLTALNAIIDDLLSQSSDDTSNEEKKWGASKHNEDIMKITLNQLTNGRRGNIKQNKKPHNTSRRNNIAGSRGTLRKDASKGKLAIDDSIKVKELDSVRYEIPANENNETI